MNPAKPAKGALLARLTDLTDPGARAFDFAEGEARFSLILVCADGRVTAFENRCPHARYPLDKLDGGVILQDARFLVCAAHGASFLADTGAFCGGPGTGEGLTRIAVRVSGDAVVMDE